MNAVGMLGTKIKALRRREGLSQVALAGRLQVSPSYLNLIENNRRPLTAPMLIRIAELFKVDLQSFASTDDARLVAEIMEVFGDPLLENLGLTNVDVRELAVGQPNVGRAVLLLYRALRSARDSARTLAGRLSDDEDVAELDRLRLPSEEVSDFLQRRLNHFPAVEEAAEALWRDARLDTEDIYRGLVAYLHERMDIEVRVTHAGSDPGAVRRYDPEHKLLTLSDQLPLRTRNFQLAHQVGLLTLDAVFASILKDAELTAPDSTALARVALANYFAAAVLMPYQPFLEAAQAKRYDIELLGHRFRCSFEQVAHRMTTLRRPGAEGVRFHFMRIDIAGNISKRFTASGIQFARFSGACPRWNIHTAFLTPGRINIQISTMPDGATYFCVARTVRRDSGGYHVLHTVQAICMGCRIEEAKNLVYSEGIDLTNLSRAVPVGVTCRLCERMDCEQRVFPPLTHPLRVDENVRGVSFYAPARRSS